MQANSVHALQYLERHVQSWSRRVREANINIPAEHYEHLLVVAGILAKNLADPRVCILTENIVDELRQALAKLARD